MRTLTLVFQSSREPAKHHRVDLTMGNTHQMTLVTCSCPAGRRGGKCKHIRLVSMLKDWGTDSEIEHRWGFQPGW